MDVAGLYSFNRTRQFIRRLINADAPMRVERRFNKKPLRLIVVILNS
jgi:hypothetical protein